MRFFGDLFKYFTFITTGILVVFSLVCVVSGVKEIYLWHLFGIIGSGAATAFITAVMFYFLPPTNKPKDDIIAFIIHFILMCVTMIILGFIFGWADRSVSGALSMVINVAGVYIIVYFVNFMTTKKDADELNKAIAENRRTNS